MGDNDPIEILKIRYAKEEISEEEFIELKEILKNNRQINEKTQEIGYNLQQKSSKYSEEFKIKKTELQLNELIEKDMKKKKEENSKSKWDKFKKGVKSFAGMWEIKN